MKYKVGDKVKIKSLDDPSSSKYRVSSAEVKKALEAHKYILTIRAASSDPCDHVHPYKMEEKIGGIICCGDEVIECLYIAPTDPIETRFEILDL